MGTVIFWGIVAILMAFVLGLFFDTLMDISDKSAVGIVLLMIGTVLFMICVIGFTLANQKYFEKKEYSATEYRINEKIVTVEENNVVKVDTLYSLTRKNK